jgi:hypothetical protein
MWIAELELLDREYDTYKRKREQIQSGVGLTKIKVKKVVAKA